MRKPLIVANWKMNKTITESQEFADLLAQQEVPGQGVDAVICPPFTSLALMQNQWAESSIKLGAQNVFWADKGSYTGEISPPMLIAVGCEYVIIGHSERRQLIGENDNMINRKLEAALNAGLIPILCVGETLNERENNIALQVVKEQLDNGLGSLNLDDKPIVIAYEPIWAIGTGLNASPSDSQEMIAFIRQRLEKLFNKELADSVRILYGGSVTVDNIAEFLSKQDIDGALVGGASLSAESYANMLRIASK